MLDGWQMMSVILGENTGAQFGASYIAAIESEINNYTNVIISRVTYFSESTLLLNCSYAL